MLLYASEVNVSYEKISLETGIKILQTQCDLNKCFVKKRYFGIEEEEGRYTQGRLGCFGEEHSVYHTPMGSTPAPYRLPSGYAAINWVAP